VKLGVLSVRDNHIHTLPTDLGKLQQLRVLDISGNRFVHSSLSSFIPHDATQSAVLLWQIVCLSVRPSICLCDVELSWSLRLDYFEYNLMAD